MFFSGNHYTSCSVIETKYYKNVIEESSIVEQTDTDGDLRQGIIDSANNHMEESKDNEDSKFCSSYRYNLEQIEEFFDSENGQVENHTLEDSICRPIIGRRQNHKQNFLYCKICPKVENINLISIEHHIRYKDPERHKAKLLEMIQGE